MSRAGRKVWNWRENTAAARRAGRLADLRRRGLVQGLVVLGVGTMFNLVFGHILLGRIVVALGALQACVAMWRPAWLARPQAFWRGVGDLVGRGLGWILLTPLWLLVFVPGGLWLCLRGRDPLHRAPLAAGATAWIPRRQAPDPGSARRQFLVEDRVARSMTRPVGALPDPALMADDSRKTST